MVNEILDILVISGLYGFIFGIMALGVFITFRILDFPDLTVDGSFPMGAAIMAILLVKGINPLLALLIAFAGGVAAGVTTALIHNYVKVPSLLAGILTMIMLYSINIRILGNRSNLSLLKNDTLLTGIIEKFQALPQEYVICIFFLVIILVIKLLLDLFFRTDLGLILRSMGNNPQMVLNQGSNPALIKVIGVGLSNGIVAVAGAFAAQYFKFSDISLGQGIIVAGLASVMIGEVLVPSNKMFIITTRVIIGSVFYQALMYIGRKYGSLIHLTASDLKLITGVLVIGAIVITNITAKRRKSKFIAKKKEQ